MRKCNTKNQITYTKNIPVEELVSKVSNKYIEKTYIYGKRPFGVGILLSGMDDEGKPHLYELSPNGNCFEYEAYAIGDKCQSAKTYLEKNIEYFKSSNQERLILHGLNAIKSGYRDEKEEMSSKNIEISLISNERGYKALSQSEVGDLLNKLNTFKIEQGMQIEA